MFLTDIIRDICREEGVDMKFLLSHDKGSRKKNITNVRRRIAKALRVHKTSYIRIGQLLNRDHHTIISLIKTQDKVYSGQVMLTEETAESPRAL